VIFSAGAALTGVAAQIRSWNPDFIATVGDNNYPDGSASTIDANIGQYFHDYISPYIGQYGAGSTTGNHFWPTLGNHDFDTGGGEPEFDYFVLPGKRALLHRPVGQRRAVRPRQRPARGRRDQQQFDPGEMAPRPARRQHRAVEDRAHAPPAVFVGGEAREHVGHAVAVPAVGRNRRHRRTRSRVRAHRPGTVSPIS
jgi:hypothetical protein